jgi:hypothetical protein
VRIISTFYDIVPNLAEEKFWLQPENGGKPRFLPQVCSLDAGRAFTHHISINEK